MKPITLGGFEAKFAGDADPWSTLSNPDEALKRRAILCAMGPGPIGRVLELAAGNGSNSIAIAPRVLRLDATEATLAGTKLIADALGADDPRRRAIRLTLPAAFPRPRYDGIVLAELLYYLSPGAMARVARAVADAMRPGGTLVLAHHHVDYYDFAQHAAGIHERFLKQTLVRWRVRSVRATSRWSVLSCRRDRDVIGPG